MRDQNTIVVSGNVGRDATFSVTQSDKGVARFSIANSRYRRNEQSQQWEKTHTTWFDVSYWGKDAEELHHLITKGTRWCVVGRCELSEYTTRDGEARTSLTVTADTVTQVPRLNRPQQSGGWGSKNEQPPW